MSQKVEKMAAQGDLLITRVTEIPSGLKPVERSNGKLIVAHSETGHHHVITRDKVTLYEDPSDPLVAWLEVHGEKSLPNIAELVHERSFDTHETLEIPIGIYQIRRQREYIPGGHRRVAD